MTDPQLLVVCGLPASGKTTLARRLGTALGRPMLCRDDLKTAMVEVRGPTAWTDPTAHAELARDSFALFHDLGLRSLQAGCSIVMEAAYHWPIARRELAPLRAFAPLVIVECRAPIGLLRDRYAGRWERGERHPCHRDGEYVARMDTGAFDGTFYDVPADIGAPVFGVDTRDGYDPAFEQLVERIRVASP